MRTLLLLLTIVSAVAAPAAGADVGHLVGTVGPGFTITLTDADGNPVTRVDAGRYELVIHDLSDQHNFVLGEKATGNRPAQTEVAFVGDETFTVDLRPGLWVYACSPHFTVMNGHFDVVAPILSGHVTARGASLSATTAAAGTYTVTVVDSSKTQAFRLVGPGVSRTTGKKFTGRATWTVTLSPGTYRFGGAKLAGTLTVS